jgi:hypothetical protein
MRAHAVARQQLKGRRKLPIIAQLGVVREVLDHRGLKTTQYGIPASVVLEI